METSSFSLKDKVAQLETIEAYFQRPDMDLEEAIRKHKEALNLAKEILHYLEQAESSIEQIDLQLASPSKQNEAEDEDMANEREV